MSVNVVCSTVYKRRLKLYHPYVNMSQKGYCLLWAKDNLKWTVYIHFTQCPSPSQVSINSCNFFSSREKLIKLPDSESETSQSNRYKMCWLQITFYMESLWTPLIFFYLCSICSDCFIAWLEMPWSFTEGLLVFSRFWLKVFIMSFFFLLLFKGL